MKQFCLTNGWGVVHYQADTRAACRAALRRMSRAGAFSGDWASPLVIQTSAEVEADLRAIARSARLGLKYYSMDSPVRLAIEGFFPAGRAGE
jgi:hypothetical protein